MHIKTALRCVAGVSHRFEAPDLQYLSISSRWLSSSKSYDNCRRRPKLRPTREARLEKYAWCFPRRSQFRGVHTAKIAKFHGEDSLQSLTYLASGPRWAPPLYTLPFAAPLTRFGGTPRGRRGKRSRGGKGMGANRRKRKVAEARA